MRRITVQGHPGQEGHKTLSQPIAGHGGSGLSSQLLELK
jgi:hypothetical protein